MITAQWRSCAFVLLTSCGVLGTPRSPASFGPNGPSATEADSYCAHLRELASGRAQTDMYWAYALGSGAVLSGATAAVLLAADDTPSATVRAFAAATPVVAGLLVVLTKGMLARESAADELAHQTSDSLTKGDSPTEIVDRCTKALSEWDRSRSDAAKLAGNMQATDKKEKDEYKDLLKELRSRLPASLREGVDQVPGLGNDSSKPATGAP